MTEGDVCLAALPQSDGQLKDRPILLLKAIPPFGDMLVCGISSQTQRLAPPLDELIVPADKDYSISGLKAPSVIRLGFLTVLAKNQIRGKIGRVSHDRLTRLLDRSSKFLRPNAKRK